jgi:peptidoglycan hydrolase-like protein with peptidoglycan-binding domain
MVDHRRRDSWARRSGGRTRGPGDEPEEERALRELQEQAGNRAVTGAIEMARDGDAGPAPTSQVDSPGLRILGALRAAPVAVQRQAVGGLLRRGMRGPEVEALQADLVRVGHALAVDGIFGPATQAAVVAFQRGAGLAADGIVGPATRGALAGGKGATKGAGKGSVEKEAWAPPEDEAAAKKAAPDEGAAEELAAKGGAVDDAAVKESEAKAGSSVEKEPWAPPDEEVAAKEEAAKAGTGAKETSETEKEDWWLT